VVISCKGVCVASVRRPSVSLDRCRAQRHKQAPRLWLFFPSFVSFTVPSPSNSMMSIKRKTQSSDECNPTETGRGH
jgi:hypothetical protein